MSFTRANPLGWGLFEILTSAQQNALDIDHSRAVDGTHAGAYGPLSTHLEFDLGTNSLRLQNGVLDVDVGVSAIFRDLARFDGNALFDGTGEVDGASTFTWLGTSNLPRLGSRVYAICVPQGPAAKNLDARWEHSGLYWVQTDVTSSGELWLPLHYLPNRGTLTGVIARIHGNLGGSGPHGALPAVKPIAALWSIVYATAVTNLEGTITDNPADVPAYEQAHDLAIGALSLPIDGTQGYFFKITGEAGANSIAVALGIVGLQANVTVDRVAPG